MTTTEIAAENDVAPTIVKFEVLHFFDDMSLADVGGGVAITNTY